MAWDVLSRDVLSGSHVAFYKDLPRSYHKSRIVWTTTRPNRTSDLICIQAV